MLIICPKCFTRFEVDSSLIKKSTQKFKCSNCGNVFEEQLHDVIPLTEKAEISSLAQMEQEAVSWDMENDNSHPLPEEFTPVFEKKKKNYAGIFSLIVVACIAGIGMYGYLNRATLLTSFPNVNKGLELLSEPQEMPVKSEVLNIYPAAETPAQVPVTQGGVTEEIDVMAPQNPVEIPMPKLGNQPAPEMLGDGTPVVMNDVTVNDKSTLPAPQVADTNTSVAAAGAPIQIKDVVFRYDDTGTGVGEQRLFVQGVVNNVTEGDLSMPVLQAQLYDKDDVLLGVRDLPHTPRTLNSKMAEFFFAEIGQLPNSIVKRVSVVTKGK